MTQWFSHKEAFRMPGSNSKGKARAYGAPLCAQVCPHHPLSLGSPLSRTSNRDDSSVIGLQLKHPLAEECIKSKFLKYIQIEKSILEQKV